MKKQILFLSVLTLLNFSIVFGMEKKCTPLSSRLNRGNSAENSFLNNQKKTGFSFAPSLKTPSVSPVKSPVLTPQSSPQQSDLQYMLKNPIGTAPYEIQKLLKAHLKDNTSPNSVKDQCYKSAYGALKYTTDQFAQSTLLEQQKLDVRKKLSPPSRIKSPKKGNYNNPEVAANRANHFVNHAKNLKIAMDQPRTPHSEKIQQRAKKIQKKLDEPGGLAPKRNLLTYFNSAANKENSNKRKADTNLTNQPETKHSKGDRPENPIELD